MIKKQKKFVTTLFLMLLILPLAILNQPATSHTVENIQAFTKLYGYVKYFHPSDEAAKIDWDRFALYGVKQVENAQNTAELKKILEELFLPLAPGMVIYPSNQKKTFSQSQIVPKDTTGMKVVAWQHYGVRVSDKPNIYNSIRINRKNKAVPGYRFGNLMKMKDAAPFKGKEFIFKAAVKAEEGKGQMWFRVDRPKKQRGFFDNMDDRPIQSDRWKTYEIKGKVAEDAVNIAYGCFLPGSGKIFADEFQLFVREGDQWTPVEIENPGFEQDTEGQKPKNWMAMGDGYNFQVTSETAFKGNKSFMITGKPAEGPSRLFDRYPKIGEHVNKELGMGLSCIVPLALYGTETNTYPIAPPEKYKQLQDALQKEVPQKLTAKDRHVRLAGIVITWNILQHFYPYFDVVKVDWNKELSRALQKAQTDQNERDFLYTLKKLIAALHDCHGHAIHELEYKQMGFPFKVGWIENRVVITRSEDDRFKRGDIIRSIDGIDAEQILLEAEKYISGSPQWKRKRSLAKFGYGDKETAAQLKIEREGKVMEITAARNFNGHLKEFERKVIEELENNIYYVDLDRLKQSEIEAAAEKLAKAKGVVFDARGYVAFGIRDVLSHLVDETIPSPIWNVPETIYPDRERVNFTDRNWDVPAKAPKISGKVVFLTHGYTISASETFMGMVEHYKLGEIVGQATAGTNGNINPFTLPGGYRIIWTGMKVLKHDHSQHHLVGIKPTVPVERTIKGVKEGRDEFLEKAVEVIMNSG